MPRWFWQGHRSISSCRATPSPGLAVARRLEKILAATVKLLSSNPLLGRSLEQLAGKPVVDAEPSWTRADEPDKKQHVQDFGKVEKIVEPAERR